MQCSYRDILSTDNNTTLSELASPILRTPFQTVNATSEIIKLTRN